MKEQTENKNPTTQFLKTDGGKSKSNAIEVPSISLPKGGPGTWFFLGLIISFLVQCLFEKVIRQVPEDS